jgi:hypothetical protein
MKPLILLPLTLHAIDAFQPSILPRAHQAAVTKLNVASLTDVNGATTADTTKGGDYGANQITVLSGLEPVRKRPGMCKSEILLQFKLNLVDVQFCVCLM